MRNWMIAAKKADFDGIARKFGISPMLARIIRNRDVVGDDEINRYLNGTVNDMYDPHLLKDADKAAGLLLDAIRSGGKIFIIGDYDIDGVCSSYILLKGMTALGGDAYVRLPDRIADGYGVNRAMIDEAFERGTDIILTCDNGIAAADDIRYASEIGMSVIVTDHHEVPFEDGPNGRKFILPPAEAIVDPKQPDCSYPFEGICGAMVAYKLMQCIFELAGEGSELLPEFLMFAGFATVGDVMELKDENRIAVKYTLKEMRNTSNKGMKALINVNLPDVSALTPYHIGFILGPCINATGRLDSATRALDMFMADSDNVALSIARELKDLNISRKELQEKYLETAFEMIEGDRSFGDERILVIYLPECHESLAGIIAGRIKERYYKPTIVLTRTEEGVKGSGRSIEAYDMHEGLTACADLLNKFGGHKMAAGMSLDEDKVDELRKRLNENCALSEEDMTEKLVADIPLPLNYATMELASELGKLEPFGYGNSKPLFVRKDLTVSDISVVGSEGKVVRMKLKSAETGALGVDAVMFGETAQRGKELKNKDAIAAVYELGINEYRGSKKVQLVIKDWRYHES